MPPQTITLRQLNRATPARQGLPAPLRKASRRLPALADGALSRYPGTD